MSIEFLHYFFLPQIIISVFKVFILCIFKTHFSREGSFKYLKISWSLNYTVLQP